MPQQWFDRMSTIRTYEADTSAMGRINAWHMAYNLAKDKPMGGGFDTFQEPHLPLMRQTRRMYTIRTASTSRFWASMASLGLGLFLILGLATWRAASWVIKRARGDSEQRWAADLAAMVQVSLVGYASAGAFLGLAYFDFYYTLSP